ncbi:MAG TPA: DUF2339 domain-containing protein [Verrucomicrobiae bacterium]|nr:DUF2339 domain-containing protein [Verrucomicrobiae bacterium]
MDQLYLILIPLFFAGSILAFVAYSVAHRLESSLKSFPPNDLAFRLRQLEQKLAELQKIVNASPSPSPLTSPPSAPSPPTAPSPQVAPPQPAPEAVRPQYAPAPREISGPALQPWPNLPPQPSHADLEALIGGRWFNRIGIIALLFAVSYFLKLAFDNNWIGPAGRVTIGILLGALMLPWSQWLLSRGYSYFAEGIAGLGEATLFVSVWAGCQYYTLFSRGVGFGALVFITIVMGALALWRDSSRIAFLSLLGGLLTPALVSSGKNEQFVLFSYLLCLGAAALFIIWHKNWQLLLPLAFIGTQLYFWQWYDAFFVRARFLDSTLIFATLFFLLFALLPIVRALHRVELRAMDLLLAFSNALAYGVSLYVFLWPDERWPLTLIFLALSAAHLLVASLLPESPAPAIALPRGLYTFLAVSFFTLAIPIRLEHNAITLVFAVEGAALVWTSFRTLSVLLRPAGYLLLVIAAFRLLDQPPPADAFLFNERFGSYFLLVACLGFPLWSARDSSPSHQSPRRTEMACLAVATNFFALISLSLEFWDYFGRVSSTLDRALAQHLSLSILWTCYAALLLLLGIQRHSPLLRWQALNLLGIVVAKVFLFDLSFLARAYRILSFFILGSVLLAVSFFYQRKLARNRPGP